MAHEAREFVSTEEIETLKRDMQKIRDDLKEICRTAGMSIKTKSEECKEQIGEMLENMKSKTGQYFSDAYKEAREKSGEAVEKSRDVVKEYPLTSVFAAFTAGVLLSSLLRRR